MPDRDRTVIRPCVPALMALTAAMAGPATGCIHDSDCGICDPEHLFLESISGTNYTYDKIHLLSPECHGDACPASRDHGHYFVTEIERCERSEAALASPRGPQEYCKLSPLVTQFGLEFVFNNLLDPTAIELVRKRPDQPKLFEVYDWKTQIVAIEGPTTRYNGDVVGGQGDAPDVVSRAVNLACIDNLRDEGRPYDHVVAADPTRDPCNQTRVIEQDGESHVVPMKMRVGTPDAAIRSYRGITTHGSAGAFDCVTPQGEGVADTCCSECDWLLSTKVAKYGVDDSGRRRTPNYEPGAAAADGAIECDPTGNAYADCAAFVPAVDRGTEGGTYAYHWSCDPAADPDCAREDFALPRYDKLRETHPDQRPAFLENFTAACTADDDCTRIHALPGTECIGVGTDGSACDPDADPSCAGGHCRAAWFVGCEADARTTGSERGLCVDRRFSDEGAGACFTAAQAFEGGCDPDGGGCSQQRAGSRLAECGDRGGVGELSAEDCCQDSLGAEIDACDPLFQPELTARPIYDRSEHLPRETRSCLCEDDPEPHCTELVAALCTDDGGRIRDERRGQYAVAFVDRAGGVVYDPAIKGFEWRPADVGNVPRARVEACAETRGLLPERNRHDGWRANDGKFIESFEDFDRAMCSGSHYTVVFATAGEHVVDKVGNDLSGRETYGFDTAAFHVVPGSGFPADSLRIGACDGFALRFSNRYDLSPVNLRKLAIYELAADDTDHGEPIARDGCGVVPVAGGSACYDDPAALEQDPCGAPCLTVDIRNQAAGELEVAIDTTRFDATLLPRHRYRLAAPGLTDIAQMADPAAYAAAFWDACGMPLVTGTAQTRDDWYDFTIDQPKCKEDPDHDEIPTSCDNADAVPNSDQHDADGDGLGDVIDLCPLVDAGGNQGDSDSDGIGNDCDVCRRPTDQYNRDTGGIDYRLLVDNNPSQRDSDGDGIGDACDNCVSVANCESYDRDSPWHPGLPIAFGDASRCQVDADGDHIGNACEGLLSDGAAGPVGFGDDDDLDQDGLGNAVDKCPRIPVEHQPCTTDLDCPEAATCEPCPATGACEGMGTCNHADSERDADGEIVGDGVGDICDTCPADDNPLQHYDEGAAEDDDGDHDFIGAACETNADCAGVGGTAPRPFDFYEISVQGHCCTVLLEVDGDGNLVVRASGDLLMDPGVRDEFGMKLREPVPVRLDCDEPPDLDPLLQTCRRLPDALAAMPGVLLPPFGCDEALAGMRPQDNPRLVFEEGDDIAAYWSHVCTLPVLDQDFDGYGDRCDLCPFDFDPENATYSDANGRLWPKAGAVCNGGYGLDLRCEVDGTDTEGVPATDGSGDGGSSSSSGTGAQDGG
ncbi:MAG: thrombospondin type 3 repeat-containing protein [Deltaproteobacteria bacterium]|nr:thrombospondin type 3 repeat-containing protein [Deltaproteobacteria bacterium]